MTSKITFECSFNLLPVFFIIFAPPISPEQIISSNGVFFPFPFVSFRPVVLQSACPDIVLVIRLVNILNLDKY
jgi:hypothetical protein